MLLVDEAGALAALPDMLPEDPAAHRRLFDRVLTVVTAAGPPSDAQRARLREIAERLGLDQDQVTDGRDVAQQAPAERPAAPASARRAPRRRAAAQR